MTLTTKVARITQDLELTSSNPTKSDNLCAHCLSNPPKKKNETNHATADGGSKLQA